MHQMTPSVCVVDDDASIRKALKRLLNAAGYRVTVSESAETFLESSSPVEADFYILDIALPGMSGLDLQEHLRVLGKQGAVIFITAHDIPQWEERAKAAGAIAYLRKPFDQYLLIQALQSPLPGRD